ncbi:MULTISPECIES: response regulator [Burkholderiaceae]|uniref:DNA-binding response regulator, LuxR family n=1 Tax=Caballeronia sordidicola TaxID=196367 RepID=A0A242MWU0_CABSO|nr:MULTISPECIES: response regulator transcription factor [Burkholderiaceae]AME28186.1 LuxR family transcriptional regulator [Burkholderia sp. PAMC 26561]OTP75910.1 DNA-binding response regulator, LuxR family [Caballeronia sordidicola]
MPRILIADDHPIVRDGIRFALRNVNGCTIVGEASDGPSALALIRTVSADLLLLDLSMPGRSGIELITQVKLAMPTLRILIVTAHAEQQYAVRSFKAGASGYVTKDCMGAELVAAVAKVASGGVYVSLSLAEALATNLHEPLEPLAHDRLSDREFDVFRRLSEGQTLTQIAEALCVSAKTVSTYKARILEKLHLPHEVALIRYAIRHELFDHNE